MAKKMMKDGKLHIGKLVKLAFDKSGLSVSELARRINYERTNVYAIFRRKSLDVELLVSLSFALEHNFLDDVMRSYGMRSDFGTHLDLTVKFDDITPGNIKQLGNLLADFKKENA